MKLHDHLLAARAGEEVVGRTQGGTTPQSQASREAVVSRIATTSPSPVASRRVPFQDNTLPQVLQKVRR